MRGKIGQLSPYPPHCADLELMLDQGFVYIFFTAFQRCVHLVFVAAQRHMWRDRCTRHVSSRGQELKCLSQ